jgi:hypothetical protein
MSAYCTRAELRALDGLGDSTVFPDADLDVSIVFAKETVDGYCGTSFGDVASAAYDSFAVTVDGSGRDDVRLRGESGEMVMYPRSVSAASVDGVADSGITYTLRPTALVVRSSGTWTFDHAGRNVTIEGTAGFSSSPSQSIRWAARSIARFWLLSLQSRVPERALQLSNSDGSFELRAQAGGAGRPTAMPDVNAILNRNRHGAI